MASFKKANRGPGVVEYFGVGGLLALLGGYHGPVVHEAIRQALAGGTIPPVTFLAFIPGLDDDLIWLPDEDVPNKWGNPGGFDPDPGDHFRVSLFRADGSIGYVDFPFGKVPGA